MTCDCPMGAALPDLVLSDCPFEFGQLQKVIVQRLTTVSGGVVTANSVSAASVKASWTALMSAVDGTKVLVLPQVYAPSIVPGDANVFGENSNDTPNGEGITVGENCATATGNFSQQPAEVVVALRSLMCENIGVYLVNAAGKIYGLDSNDTTTTPPETDHIKPIPIKNFFVKGYEMGTMDNPTKNDFSFKLSPEWYKGLLGITPTDFDALSEL